MWTLFKALPTAVKLGWIIGLLISISAIIGGTYYAGYNKGVNISALEIEEFKTKSVQLQNQLDNVVTKVDTKYIVKYIEKKVYIKEKADQLEQTIETVFVPTSEMTFGWVHGYNSSISGVDVTPADIANTAPSGFTDKDVLLVATSNNKICLDYKNNLTSLQDLVKEREKELEKLDNVTISN